MAQYIDKDALLAEIEKRKTEAEYNCSGFKSHAEHVCDSCQVAKYEEFEEIINTLEVKEVDLDKYINKYFKGWYVDLTDQGNILHSPDGQAGLMSVKKVAKHFFELGMLVSNKAQK